MIREVDHSFPHSEAYRYPLALFTLPDGRTGLVHCPDAYNRLDIEDALTGGRLTIGTDREPDDFFHSRLAVTPSGRYLLSAGWVWHPWGCLAVHDLTRALTEPTTLDSSVEVFDPGSITEEVSGACFVGEGIAIRTSAEPDPDEPVPAMLALWTPATRTFVWRRQLGHAVGDLVPMAGNILALHDHPRLYAAATGDLIAEWPGLKTGHAESAIVWDKTFTGPARVAVDQTNKRFATTDGDRITVVQLG